MRKFDIIRFVSADRDSSFPVFHPFILTVSPFILESSRTVENSKACWVSCGSEKWLLEHLIAKSKIFNFFPVFFFLFLFGQGQGLSFSQLIYTFNGAELLNKYYTKYAFQKRNITRSDNDLSGLRFILPLQRLNFFLMHQFEGTLESKCVSLLRDKLTHTKPRSWNGGWGVGFSRIFIYSQAFFNPEHCLHFFQRRLGCLARLVSYPFLSCVFKLPSKRA